MIKEIKNLLLEQEFLSPGIYLNSEERLPYPAEYSAAIAALPYSNYPPPDDPDIGEIAPFAAENYYREAARRLKTVYRQIRERRPFEKRHGRIFVNSPLPEKEIAAACGTGFIGKNSLIIIPNHGSLTVLGGIILPFPLKSTGMIENGDVAGGNCGTCRRCIEACPVNAIDDNGNVDTARCLQALLQRYELMDDNTMKAAGRKIYGCNICQDVCPFNKIPRSPVNTGAGSIGPGVEIGVLIQSDPDQIRKMLKGTALGMSWIDPRAIKRNGIIAAGNSGMLHHIPVLRRIAADTSDPILRRTAIWAVRRISGLVVY
ncbi:MAG: epoxyqueuosine reductase [Spirochaetia bacterium]